MFYAMDRFIGQSFFLPDPPLTEKNLGDQTGKVFVVTGSNTGVGYQLATILYGKNAKVYVAARTESKAKDAIESIKKTHPTSKGGLEYLHLDLSDLTSIKPTVEDFLSRETKLHWLDNNAGVMTPPAGSKGAQGMDLQYQTNILGPFLLTKLLSPLLKRTAENEPEGSVRVSWAGSLAVDLQSPRDGLAWTKDKDGRATLDETKNERVKYGVTKAANFYLAHQFGKRFGARDRVLHDSYNPGNLASELQRHANDQYPSWALWLLHKMLYPSVYGAYTELYAGLSPALTLKDQGAYIVPWGRRQGVRKDLEKQVATEGGEADKLFEWCERVTEKYA